LLYKLRQGFALGLLDGAQPIEFGARQVLFDAMENKRPQRVWRDSVQLDGKIAAAPRLRPAIGALGGRLGSCPCSIWADVTAARVKWISALGASSRRVLSIDSAAFTPEGSRSPK
jgi:hypothetical protein